LINIIGMVAAAVGWALCMWAKKIGDAIGLPPDELINWES